MDLSTLTDPNIITHLVSLRTHPGWVAVVSIMRYNIELLKDQLLVSDFTDTAQVTRIQDQIRIYQNVMETIDMVEARGEGAGKTLSDFDPYPQPAVPEVDNEEEVS